jgi:hypothetical protein
MVVRYPPKANPVTGGEPPLQRLLRLGNARFQNSPMFATIVVLDLYKRSKNIDNLGLVITLRPRAHPALQARLGMDCTPIYCDGDYGCDATLPSPGPCQRAQFGRTPPAAPGRAAGENG